MKYYYTYLIKCIPINKVYYGVRSSLNQPKDDLWINYFTSSKLVKSLIKQYGTSAFEFEIRRIFLSLEDSLKWESKVLRRAKIFENQHIWLNRNIAGVILKNETMRQEQSIRMKNNNPMHNIILTPTQRTARSEAKLGVKNPRYGYVYSTEERLKISERQKGSVHSLETKEKIRIKAIGRTHSKETKNKLSIVAKNRKSHTLKTWSIETINHQIIKVDCLPDFANRYNLNKSKLRYTLKTGKFYNGYRCIAN